MGRRLPLKVNDVRLNIERWRGTREKRSPMPDELWIAAVALAREFSVCSMARALCLDYKALRTRATRTSAVRTPPVEFVELRPPTVGHAPSLAECILELSDTSGIKIVLRRTGGADIDALRLIEVFRLAR